MGSVKENNAQYSRCLYLPISVSPHLPIFFRGSIWNDFSGQVRLSLSVSFAICVPVAHHTEVFVRQGGSRIMDAHKPRLGRGLDSLLGTMNDAPGATAGTLKVAVGVIQQNPFQPRKRFDDDELKQLADSIRVHGVLQPIVVRAQGEGYQLIAGERRLRASQMVGLTEVPVHVVPFDDQQVNEAALVENIQRSDLNAIEKAQGFKDYIEKYNLSHEQLGQRLGMDRSSISNLVGLLNLPTEVQEAVRHGQINLGHAKVIKGVADAEKQIQLAREVILKQLSVHALELLAKDAKLDVIEKKTGTRPPVEKTSHVSSLENNLRERFMTRVEIKVKAREKGSIVIGFDSNDEFERIMDALTK
jgi:ParB family transcriptional regulator, chromosome partitioning protein